MAEEHGGRNGQGGGPGAPGEGDPFGLQELLRFEGEEALLQMLREAGIDPAGEPLEFTGGVTVSLPGALQIPLYYVVAVQAGQEQAARSLLPVLRLMAEQKDCRAALRHAEALGRWLEERVREAEGPELEHIEEALHQVALVRIAYEALLDPEGAAERGFAAITEQLARAVGGFQARLEEMVSGADPETLAPRAAPRRLPPERLEALRRFEAEPGPDEEPSLAWWRQQLEQQPDLRIYVVPGPLQVAVVHQLMLGETGTPTPQLLAAAESLRPFLRRLAAERDPEEALEALRGHLEWVLAAMGPSDCQERLQEAIEVAAMVDAYEALRDPEGAGPRGCAEVSRAVQRASLRIAQMISERLGQLDA